MFNEKNTVQEYICKILTTNPDSKIKWKRIIANQLQRDETQVLIEPILAQKLIEFNPEIEGIFVPSGKVGLIASLVNRKNIKIIGYDTTPLNLKYLNNKKITFLISQKSFNQGFDSIIYMRDFILNKINPKKANLSPIEIITKENLEFSKQNTIES